MGNGDEPNDGTPHSGHVVATTPLRAIRDMAFESAMFRMGRDNRLKAGELSIGK